MVGSFGGALYTVLQFFHPVFLFFTAVLAVKNENFSPRLELMYFKGYFAFLAVF